MSELRSSFVAVCLLVALTGCAEKTGPRGRLHHGAGVICDDADRAADKGTAVVRSF